MPCRVAKKEIYIVSYKKQATYTEASCVTVLLRKLAHNAFHFQIILLSSSGHSIYDSDLTYTPRIYQL